MNCSSKKQKGKCHCQLDVVGVIQCTVKMRSDRHVLFFFSLKILLFQKETVVSDCAFLELYCATQWQCLSPVCGPRTFTIDGTFSCTGNNTVVSHATKRSNLKLKLKENSQHDNISCYVKLSPSLAPLNVISM